MERALFADAAKKASLFVGRIHERSRYMRKKQIIDKHARQPVEYRTLSTGSLDS